MSTELIGSLNQIRDHCTSLSAVEFVQGLMKLSVSEKLAVLCLRFTEPIGGNQQHITRIHLDLSNLIRLKAKSSEHAKWNTRQGNFIQASRRRAQHEREWKPSVYKTNRGI